MDGRFFFVEAEKCSECPNDLTYEYKYDENKGDLISQQFDFIQQILFYEGVFFNLTKVDSIYAASLHENNIHVQYRLNYTDSLGNNIKSRGANIDKGFQTTIIPIVNGTTAGAIVKISSPAIFQSMLKILIVSILIFFFIIACMIYEVKVFLTQRQLYQLWNNFVHALSHDMKTPLATIHSVLVQLDNGSLDVHPEMKNKFSVIAIEQTLNLQSIVNQILTVAYINQKQLVLNKQEINLPEMIHSLIDKFTVVKEKDITFYEKYDLKEKPVYADHFYLENAISNLIDNAIKYSGNAVKINIECTAGDKQIYIDIKDNGFGISKNDQQKIFDCFERGVEIKRKRISGFGLGLNYVKCVIEAHGGAIALVSREGVGSEFTITIPTYL
ncbi:MAG: HAMP domain-containing histidine kinase [Dysgonamonadaceae bacterium]|nr:HAMP domain-containing histidine kinase [Dysgonamonadaceae bacterium]